MQNTFQHDTLKMFLLGQLASGLDVSPIYDIRCVHHKHFGGYENLNKSGFHQFIRIQPTTSCRYLLDNKCRWSFPSPPNKKLQVSKPTLPTLRYAVSAVCCGGLGTAFYFASLLGYPEALHPWCHRVDASVCVMGGVRFFEMVGYMYGSKRLISFNNYKPYIYILFYSFHHLSVGTKLQLYKSCVNNDMCLCASTIFTVFLENQTFGVKVFSPNSLRLEYTKTVSGRLGDRLPDKKWLWITMVIVLCAN